jgi:hypothetical protein
MSTEPNGSFSESGKNIRTADKQPSQSEPPPPTADEPKYDEEAMGKYLEELRKEQNLLAGTAVATAGMVAGAILWAAVTYATKFQIGFMAIGIGILVGGSMRKFGKGIDNSFAYMGAILSFLGCALGNWLTMCVAISDAMHTSFLAALVGLALNPGVSLEVMSKGFDVMDVVFYGIAVWEGYKLSYRRLTPDEMEQFRVKE